MAVPRGVTQDAAYMPSSIGEPQGPGAKTCLRQVGEDSDAMGRLDSKAGHAHMTKHELWMDGNHFGLQSLVTCTVEGALVQHRAAWL